MNKQHQNQVRIIGGQHRGRKIHFADAAGLRPTADSVRERLFNWLGQDLTGKTVLDLFAGSGVLGMEAASRHAARVIMVEYNASVASQVQKNVNSLNLMQVEVICAEALNCLARISRHFDVVFLDPPYAWQQWPVLLNRLPELLSANALVYIEAAHLPECSEPWTLYRQGQSGISRFALWQYTGTASA